jgi:hypothetical protein
MVKINVVESYEKYWKFLSCGNTGWLNDVDEKTSRRILVGINDSRNFR